MPELEPNHAQLSVFRNNLLEGTDAAAGRSRHKTQDTVAKRQEV